MEKIKQWIVAHKLWSIIIASALVVGIALSIVLPITLSHKHTFSEDWSVSSAYHWHACTGEGCSKTKDKAEHDFDADRRCTVCGKKEFNLQINIDETVSTDTGVFQSYWLDCPDAEYMDVNTWYSFEYYKYGEDGVTLTFVGNELPDTAGRYQVKVIFDGDETYLPAQVTADFLMA